MLMFVIRGSLILNLEQKKRQKLIRMSEFENSMTMNSLMDEIHLLQRTEYVVENDDHYMEGMPQFMRSLIAHLQELCLTQTSVDHIHHQLQPFVSEYLSHHNPKSTVEGFFREFLRLFAIETTKINRIGEKKLKFLTQTVSKQIFSEIMHMTCDLKMQAINRTHNHKFQHRRRNSTALIIGTINRFYRREELACFRQMKCHFKSSVESQERLVSGLTDKIEKMNAMAVLKDKSRLASAMSFWRRNTLEIAQDQSVKMSQSLKEFSDGMIESMVRSWGHNPKEWSRELPHYLTALFHSVLGTHQNIGVDFVFNPKFETGMNSLEYSNPSSFRSSLSHRSRDSVWECLNTDEIKYDNQNNSVKIPLTVDEPVGVLIIDWNDHFPLIFFQKSLKLLELLKQILTEGIRISNRLTYHAVEFEENQWQNDLYNLYTNEGAVELSQIQDILQRMGITCLQIYHDKSHPRPCISYGSQSAPPFAQNIYSMIWDKIEKSHSFTLERNNANYQITKLGKDPSQGFCRYLFLQPSTSNPSQENHNNDKSLRSIFIQCIVPLVLNHLGRIGCELCSIKIQEGAPQNLFSSDRESLSQKLEVQAKSIDLSALMFVKQSHSMQEIQERIYQLLSSAFSGKPIFSKFFYTLNESTHSYCYRMKRKQEPGYQVKSIQMPKPIAAENICEYQGVANQSKEWEDFVNVLQGNPLFNDAPLYLYEKEKSKSLKILPCRIARKGLLVLATYEKCEETKVVELLKMACTQVHENESLFKKTDGLYWATQIYEDNLVFSLPTDTSMMQIIEQSQQKSLISILSDLTVSLGFAEKILMWKINPETNSSCFIAENSDHSAFINIPYVYALEEPLQSHQRVPGSHKLVRRSKKLGMKLQQHLTYIPHFSKNEEKMQFAKLLLEKIVEKGESVDPACSILTDFFTKTELVNKEEDQWLSVPVKVGKKVYLLVLIHKKQKVINQKQFESLSNYLSQLITKILTVKKQYARSNALANFPSNLTTNQKKLKQSINKFAMHRHLENQKKNIISITLKKSVESLHYRFLIAGFQKIMKKSELKRHAYIKGCEYFTNKVIRMFGTKILFEKITSLEKRRNAMKILSITVQKIMMKASYSPRLTVSFCFGEICQFSALKEQRRVASRIKGMKILEGVCRNVDHRNRINIFRKSTEISISLKKSLWLIIEEITILEPQGLRACLNFLNNRLNLILTQHSARKTSIEIQYIFSKPNISQELEEAMKYTMIGKTSFGLLQSENQHGHKDIIPILEQILPDWETKYKELTLRKMKVLSDRLQSMRRKNLKTIFSFTKACRNKENINELNLMRRKANEQKQAMYKMQYDQNTVDHHQKKENHKKEVKEMKHNVSILQNEQQKLAIEMRIKSKTNAAYRMLAYLNKKGHEGQEEDNHSLPVNFGRGNEMARKKEIGQYGRLWAASLNRIIKRVELRGAYDGISAISAAALR